MGAFHCPVGALGYDSDGCINCGMCIAKTEQERFDASNIIREYLRNNVCIRKDRKIRKIAVCGKGGVGKSTFAALLAMSLEEYGYKILLIDTDDSNMGLYRKIGVMKQPKQVYKAGNCDENYWAKKDPLMIDDIPEEHIEKNGNISIIGIGKIVDSFQGCACDSMELARQLVLNLKPKDDEIIISDSEAGLESFGRGVEQGCDTIITVVEPSFESIEMSNTMQYMAEGFGITRIHCVVSKAFDQQEADFIIDELNDKDIKYLGAIFMDKTVSKANLLGTDLRETDTYSIVKELTKLLLDEAEMKY